MIAKHKTIVNGEPATVYAVKVINRTWLYSVFDVKCELSLLETVNTPGGSNAKSITIPLIVNQAWFIKSRYFNNDQNLAPYAILFGTKEDLDGKWDDNTNRKLQFKIMCKHSMSGFSKVFDRVYHMRSECIKEGKFRFGDTFEIV